MYPYILSIDSVTKCEVYLTESNIKGIYGAKLLLRGSNTLAKLIGSDQRLQLRSTVYTSNTTASLRDGYSSLLYIITNYAVVTKMDHMITLRGQRREDYHLVAVNGVTVRELNDNDPYEYIITVYQDDGSDNIGVKICAPNPNEFLVGFIEYFRLRYQYGDIKHLPSFVVHAVQNGYIVGSTFNSTLGTLLFTQHPREIQDIIRSYCTYEFRYVDKRGLKEFQRSRKPLQEYDTERVYNEVVRRVKDLHYTDDRVIEMISPTLSIESLLEIAARLSSRPSVLRHVVKQLHSRTNGNTYVNELLGGLSVLSSVRPAFDGMIKEIILCEFVELDHDTMIKLLCWCSQGIANILVQNKGLDPLLIPYDQMPSSNVMAKILRVPTIDLSVDHYGIVHIIIQLEYIDLYDELLNRIHPSVDNNVILDYAINVDDRIMISTLLSHPKFQYIHVPTIRRLCERHLAMITDVMNSPSSFDGHFFEPDVRDLLICTIPSVSMFKYLYTSESRLDDISPGVVSMLVQNDLVSLVLSNSTFDVNKNNGSLLSLLILYKKWDLVKLLVTSPNTEIRESHMHQLRSTEEGQRIIQQHQLRSS